MVLPRVMLVFASVILLFLAAELGFNLIKAML